MEEREDRLLAGSTGKTISVYYNDTHNSVSFKTGRFLDFDSHSLLILENGNQSATLIPRRKCIRMEIREEAKAEIKN